jgi:hypothetical protein
MRNKIILVNAIIVAIVGILAFVLMRSSIQGAASNPEKLLAESKRDAQGASSRLQLDGLRVERWLTEKAEEPATLDAFGKADPTAAGAAATTLCDQIVSQAKGAPDLQGTSPAMVMLVDANGKTIGRNGSNLGRGEDISAVYPALKTILQKGTSGSDVWINKGRNDQFLTSYAAVRNEKGVIGAIIAGVTINDELSRVSDVATGRALVLVAAEGDGLSVLARSAADTSALDELVGKGASEKGAKDTIKGVLAQGHTDATAAGDLVVAATPLEGFGDGKSKVLVAAAPATAVEGAASIPLPILGVTVLGIILVVVGGWLLGSYIMAPIGVLEEGLLAILNGQTEKRFQLEHAELGGLAFRIDQLLNQLMGVEEDNTDEQGRVSRPPTAAAMNQAVGMEQSAVMASAELANEPPAQYYPRLYREYIAAKKALGEAVDHITEQTFTQRIQGMEAEAQQKTGKPVRYQVQSRGNEVVLLPVSIG